ncbi:MAG: leucine-rich repeat protein, partial [Phoenicibacter congonensis]|nr:leucine-rich repeat protein [Phoenicibacter congonensis]
MKDQSLTESNRSKGGALVSNEMTVRGAILRVALAFALVLGLMPSLGNSVAFANESNEDSNAALAGYPSAKDLTVTFDFDGGTTTAQSVQKVEFDGSEYYVSSPDPLPTKDGFELTGWEIQSPDEEEILDASFEDEAFFDRDTNFDSAVTLKAQWKESSSADSWTADDFTYDETDASTITGLSDSGKTKIVTNTEVVIPSAKADGTAITAIGNDSTTDNLFKVTVDDKTYEATNVTIPEGVTSIGKMAFKSYAGESIALPSTLTAIGIAAFQGSKLTSIVLPDSVTTVANGAFSNSTGLKTVKFGKGMTSVPQAMFSMCSVKDVVIPEGITSIGRSAFAGCHSETLTFEGTSTCTEIAQSAFENNQFESLVIPASVKTIGKSAFRVYQNTLSKKLTSLTLNEGLETIS